MEHRREERRQLPLVKIAIIAAAVAAALLTLMFIHEHREEVAARVANNAVSDAFFDGGELYTLYSSDNSILRPVSDKENYLFLPGDGAQWSEAIHGFIYHDGSKVKTCDRNGKNAETIFKVSGFRRLALSYVIGDYVVVRPAYSMGRGMIQGTDVCSIINLVTGDVLETELGGAEGAGYMCAADGFLYYNTGDEMAFGTLEDVQNMYYDIRRCNLTTGECEIVTDDLTDSANDYGCVADGYLYFTYSSDRRIQAVPVTGGDVEELDLHFGEYGTSGASLLLGYDGKVLMACFCTDGGGGYAVKVLAFDPSDGGLSAPFSWPVQEDSMIVNMRVQDGVLIVVLHNGTVLQEKLA